MKSEIKKFINNKNKKKRLFTPGPASLLYENVASLEPCFGRGDLEYNKIEDYVLKKLKQISKHKFIARMQGSASFALEIMINNFIYGKILIIKTGIYSDRLYSMSIASKLNFKNIKTIDYIEHRKINEISKKYDWIMGCPVETSVGMKIPISKMYQLKKKCKAKLALDATASIGLEKNHDLAEVIAYSSCKGLFGLTGASFVAFNINPNNKINQFNFNIFNHLEKKMTGPYHSICSLYYVLQKYNDFKYSVIINKKIFLKKMKDHLVYKKNEEPYLCTLINKKVSIKDKNTILYQSRADILGSVVCHLGEVHLKKKAKGKIIDSLKIT